MATTLAPVESVVRPEATAPNRVMAFMGISAARSGNEPYLDGLRAVAVLSVLLYHCLGVAEAHGPLKILGTDVEFIFARLYLGVDLFFVLSGFLLARPWFVAAATGTARPRVRQFLGRRLKRIVPAYYFCFLLVMAVFGYLDDVPQQMLTGWTGFVNIVAHLLFLHGYVPIAYSDFNFNSFPWWTLTVEMTWYLVLPVVAIAFLGRRWLASLVALAGLSMGWIWLWTTSMNPVIDAAISHSDPVTLLYSGFTSDFRFWFTGMFVNSLPSFMSTFALGVVLAKVQVGGGWRWLRQSLVGSAAALAVVVGMIGWLCWLSRDPLEQNYYRPAFGVLIAAGVFVVAFGHRAIRRPFEWLPLRYVGWVSFGIYLIHEPLLHLEYRGNWFTGWGGFSTLFALAAVTLVISTSLATLSWLFVERPFLVGNRAADGSAWPPPVRRRWVAGALVVGAVAAYIAGTWPSASDRAWGNLTSKIEEQGITPLLSFVPKVDLGVRDSGPMTVADAYPRQRIDSELAWFIATCRRVDAPGAVYAMSADRLYITASVFSCTDSQAAQQVIELSRQHSTYFGQARTVTGVSDHAVVRSLAVPGTLPDRVQIRYRSGFSVVTIDVMAMDPVLSNQHALDLWYFASHTYTIS